MRQVLPLAARVRKAEVNIFDLVLFDEVHRLAVTESLEVTPGNAAAKVIVNARTGSVVMNQAVTLDSCAVSHGNLSIVINTTPAVSQPNPLSGGQTVVTQTSQIDLKKDPGHVLLLNAGASLADATVIFPCSRSIA